MELWSLMHFLMPHIFQSHKEFKDWFSNPVHSMIEGEQQINEDLINRLHSVLRPFILRRLKSEVEKQLPPKIEHVIRCRLSKRQRLLYEEFMAATDTKKTLSSGNFLGIVNILMQLRKVTNHPDLFESRPIVSPFDLEALWLETSSLVTKARLRTPFDLGMDTLNLRFTQNDNQMTSYQAQRTIELCARQPLIMELGPTVADNMTTVSPLSAYKLQREEAHAAAKRASLVHLDYINEYRCSARPIYGANLVKLLTINKPANVHQLAKDPKQYLGYSNLLKDMILLPEQRMEQLRSIITHFVCIIPSARASSPRLHCSHPEPSLVLAEARQHDQLITELSSTTTVFRPAFVRSQLYFPDKRLVQYDCGKLQELSKLLRKLKAEGHRALIFTQMTRMLDILEIFLNIYGYTYLRLDGATKVERRQMAMERFNKDPRIFLFILSTRSGGKIKLM
jgi:E1A-binding protein p400